MWVRDEDRVPTGVEDGSREAYNRLVALRDLANPARFQEASQLLDLAQHIDYTLLQIYGLNFDWPDTNWRAARNRVANMPFRFFVWDFETSLDLLSPNHALYQAQRVRDISNTAGVDGIHLRLLDNPEYRMLFADRARKHLFGDGELSDTASKQRYSNLADQLEPALIAEIMRWGDTPIGPLAKQTGGAVWDSALPAGPGLLAGREADWKTERARMEKEFFPRRNLRVLWQLCERVLYPPVVAPALSPPGGTLQPGLRVRLAPDEGGCPGAQRQSEIYYTTDGSDPRQPGSGDPNVPWSGRPSISAKLYDGPIALKGPSQIRARAVVKNQGQWIWSAISEGSFGQADLWISEIHYQPEGDGRAEFIEIENLRPRWVDLSGVELDGIKFRFPPGKRLEPRGRALLIHRPSAFLRKFQDRDIAGVFQGRLANEGELLRIIAADGTELDRGSLRTGWSVASYGRRRRTVFGADCEGAQRFGSRCLA